MQKDHGESPVVTDDAEPPSSLARLTAEIVSAYVSNNKIAASDIATLITAVGHQMAKVGTDVAPPAEEKPEPAVSARRSIRPDHLTCLICGKPQKMLKVATSQERPTRGMAPSPPSARGGAPPPSLLGRLDGGGRRRRRALPRAGLDPLALDGSRGGRSVPAQHLQLQ